MKEKNYTSFTFIRNVFNVLLMLLFVNFGWGQAVDIITPRDQVSGFGIWSDTDVAGSTYVQLLKSTSVTITPAMNFGGYTSETLRFKAGVFWSTNAVENAITVEV